MIDTPHPGAAPNNTGTVLDFDAARSRTRAVGDWTASFTRLLGMAFREVDTDRERAKAVYEPPAEALGCGDVLLTSR